MAKEPELDNKYLEIDRLKQSYDYPDWIVDMYSNPTPLTLEQEVEEEAFLFEEYWQGHIDAFLYHEDMGDR